MLFEELQIAAVNVRNPESLYKLLVTDLCGEKYFRDFETRLKPQIEAFISISSHDGLNYEQFRISYCFYSIRTELPEHSSIFSLVQMGL